MNVTAQLTAAEQQAAAEYLAGCKVALESALQIAAQVCEEGKACLKTLGVKEYILSKELGQIANFCETKAAILVPNVGASKLVQKSIAKWKELNALSARLFLDLYFTACRIPEKSVDAFKIGMADVSDICCTYEVETFDFWTYISDYAGFVKTGEFYTNGQHTIQKRLKDGAEAIEITQDRTRLYFGKTPQDILSSSQLFKILEI